MKKIKIDKYLKKIQIKRELYSHNVTLATSEKVSYSNLNQRHGSPLKNNVFNKGRFVYEKYRMAVVIPVYGEYEYIGKVLNSLSVNNYSSLVVLVINNPAEGANGRYVKQNQRLLRELENGSFQEKFHLNKLNTAWLDASGKGLELPGKGGVGMARKLGMDSTLNYLDWDNDPIIISLDADTLVEENYLKSIESFFNEHTDISAASISFKHLSGNSPEEERAIREYEYYIKYYVNNLKRAGSPYAYHTIGSAMVCRADAYIRAGGMKLHRGGEDFYFMQGLRKLAPIMEITDTIVYPSARPSDRVPFGTGPKVQECLNGTQLKLYNPKIFDILKVSLQYAESWIYSGNVAQPEMFIGLLSEEAADYFISLGFKIIWANILKNNVKKEDQLSENDRKKLLWAFHVWFDAFKTLKFVHFLEKEYPGIYSKIDIAYFKNI